MIPTGLEQKQTVTVAKEHTAAVVGSGNAQVLATPFLITMFEKTANEMCFPYLEEGTSTVGTKIDVNHLAATPIGMQFTTVCKITEVDGRKIVFSLEAFDETEKIADGTHTRFIVYSEKFQQKCNAKLQ